MANEFKSISENSALSDEMKQKLQNEMEQRLQEATKAIRAHERREVAARFKQSQDELVNIMEQFLEDKISVSMKDLHQDRKKLIQERAKLTQARLEAKKEYKQKLNEELNTLTKFMTKALAKEVAPLTEDHKDLLRQKKEVAIKLRESRQLYKKQMAERINMLDKFCWDKLSKELVEFHQDKRLLVEKRAEMIKEAREVLEQEKINLRQNGAKLIEKVIEQQLHKEMSQLKESIRGANENRFGRKMFEAFVEEFMYSHLADGTKSKKLMIENQKHNKKLDEAMQLLEKQQNLLEQQVRKAQLLEDEKKRQGIISELTSNLKGSQKALMVEMLDGVRTENLREQFNNYLDVVLERKASNRKQQLSEQDQHKIRARREVTGNRVSPHSRLSESLEQNNPEMDNEIAQIRKYAGLLREES